MPFINYSLLSRGRDTVRAANRGHARSQAELYTAIAMRLEALQGASADDATVVAMWAEALRHFVRAVEQGFTVAQAQCGVIYSTGGRSVPQNWTTAAKWWRKAAEAGDLVSQWDFGLCYYYGQGVDRDVAQAMVWSRRAAAQGHPQAPQAAQSGVPGHQALREVLVRFPNAGSAPTRHAVAHQFARDTVNEKFLGPMLQTSCSILQEIVSEVPQQPLRDSVWMDFMIGFGLSEEDELEIAKRIHAYSLRTCTFCGSNSAQLRNCSLCMELRYCIDTDCQHGHWNKTPAAESHKVLCPRIFVRGSKGRTRWA
jgi:hypothetical protein